eukprot:642209-Pelagomonas_calceolata.AAC.3
MHVPRIRMRDPAPINIAFNACAPHPALITLQSMHALRIWHSSTLHSMHVLRIRHSGRSLLFSQLHTLGHSSYCCSGALPGTQAARHTSHYCPVMSCCP